MPHFLFYPKAQVNKQLSQKEKLRSINYKPALSSLEQATSLDIPTLFFIKWSISRKASSSICTNKDLSLPTSFWKECTWLRVLCLLKQGAPAREKHRMKDEMKISKNVGKDWVTNTLVLQSIMDGSLWSAKAAQSKAQSLKLFLKFCSRPYLDERI